MYTHSPGYGGKDDMSRRQFMLFTSLAVKSDIVAPAQGWGPHLLSRAGCPPQWQNHIINLAKRLEDKWRSQSKVMNLDNVDWMVAEEFAAGVDGVAGRTESTSGSYSSSSGGNIDGYWRAGEQL
ncbi:hypothetical protein FOZ61_008660 [Perkinsus olseni]|uniref:Uncharacterized protein n=1 Tax=Perkinsus olseni TaxID=32597 RepID=A0A7J6L4E1_PEROL|nr:hypothetical protein FOZ61_008660 [Perkinsus olseni]